MKASSLSFCRTPSCLPVKASLDPLCPFPGLISEGSKSPRPGLGFHVHAGAYPATWQRVAGRVKILAVTTRLTGKLQPKEDAGASKETAGNRSWIRSFREMVEADGSPKI